MRSKNKRELGRDLKSLNGGLTVQVLFPTDFIFHPIVQVH